MNPQEMIVGNAINVLPTLPEASIDSCVTSPPYYGHRINAGSTLGNEDTVSEYADNLVLVFREIKRILVPRGVAWLNLGDTYRFKQLLGVPWRVAFGLQDDGWIVRSEVVWMKPNARPESARDRPSRDFEVCFLLAQRPDHLFYADEIREPAAWEFWGQQTSAKAREQANGGSWQSANPSRRAELAASGTKHPRSVWSIPSENRNVGGQAPMPLALASRLVASSCPPNGVVLDPFMGSGTTGVACLQSGKRFVGIDSDTAMVDVARSRLHGVVEEVRA